MIILGVRLWIAAEGKNQLTEGGTQNFFRVDSAVARGKILKESVISAGDRAITT
jgi:hypothetical protein